MLMFKTRRKGNGTGPFFGVFIQRIHCTTAWGHRVSQEPSAVAFCGVGLPRSAQSGGAHHSRASGPKTQNSRPNRVRLTANALHNGVQEQATFSANGWANDLFPYRLLVSRATSFSRWRREAMSRGVWPNSFRTSVRTPSNRRTLTAS